MLFIRHLYYSHPLREICKDTLVVCNTSRMLVGGDAAGMRRSDRMENLCVIELTGAQGNYAQFHSVFDCREHSLTVFVYGSHHLEPKFSHHQAQGKSLRRVSGSSRPFRRLTYIFDHASST